MIACKINGTTANVYITIDTGRFCVWVGGGGVGMVVRNWKHLSTVDNTFQIYITQLNLIIVPQQIYNIYDN